MQFVTNVNAEAVIPLIAAKRKWEPVLEYLGFMVKDLYGRLLQVLPTDTKKPKGGMGTATEDNVQIVIKPHGRETKSSVTLFYIFFQHLTLRDDKTALFFFFYNRIYVNFLLNHYAFIFFFISLIL